METREQRNNRIGPGMIRKRPVVSYMRAASWALNMEASLSGGMGKGWGLNRSVQGSVGVTLGGPKTFSCLGNFHDLGSGELTRTLAHVLGKLHGDLSKDVSNRALKECGRVRWKARATGHQGAAGSEMHTADSMPYFLTHKYFIIFPCGAAIKCTDFAVQLLMHFQEKRSI